MAYASNNEISIAPDLNSDSEGSGYETGSEYSTQSLSASIYEYRFENGRRYHAYKDGKYPFPNDETEQDRLDIMHHIMNLLLNNKLHLAPIVQNPQKILDVGTGTGIWAIDIAECYPSAKVIGTDLSPIQPTWVPPNVQFQIDDAEAEWTWARDSFDYIHIRHLAGAIKDWPAMLIQAYKCLKPGGYIEIHEFHMGLFSDDGSYNEHTAIWKFYALIGEAAVKSGRGFNVASQIEPLLKEAGFDEIHIKLVQAPMGTWPADPKQKERGAYQQMASESGFEAIGMALLTRNTGAEDTGTKDTRMSPTDARKLIDQSRADLRNKKIHSYSKHYFGYGRKPLD